MKYRILYLAVLAVVVVAWSVTRASAGGDTPQTYMVDTLNDESTNSCATPNFCSLRNAIIAANGNDAADTITFAASLNEGTITTLASELPQITDHLTITGPGSALLTIDAGSDFVSEASVKGGGPKGDILHRIFYVNGEGPINVSISGLTLTNAGTVGSGPAIFADDDTVAIDDVMLLDNLARGEEVSGGAVSVSSGPLTVTDSLFMGNRSDSNGGALFAGGTLTLTNTDFMSNSNGGDGAGLHFTGSTLTIDGGTFDDNDTDECDCYGGGIYIDSSGTAMLTGVNFDDNAGAAGGGALAARGEGVDVTISGGSVVNNVAIGPGGGIYLASTGGTLTLADVTVEGNESYDGSGGGIAYWGGALSVTGGTVSDNTGNSRGGGIYVGSSGTAMLTGVMLVSNNSQSHGGAIGVDGSFSQLTVSTSDLLMNSTNSGNGGGLYFYSTGGSLVVEDTSIEGNDANGEDTGYGGGIYAFASNSGSAMILASNLSGNSAIESGGGVYLTNVDSVDVVSSSIVGNKSGEDGGGVAIGWTQTAPEFLNNTVSGNSASRFGGGFYVYNSNQSTQILHNTITNNTANTLMDSTGNGGGLYIDTSGGSQPANLVNTILSGNTVDAASPGGASKGLNENLDCDGTVTSEGVNLIGDDTGCTGLFEDDLIGDDPVLGQLTMVPGKAIFAHDLLLGSAAIDAAGEAECAEEDALGRQRVPTACDIGAVESIAFLLFLLSEDGGCVMGGTGAAGGVSLALLLLAVAGAFAFERRRRRG